MYVVTSLLSDLMTDFYALISDYI
ncbi:hypothetical protein ABFA07_022935 [Porites harrisoni]